MKVVQRALALAAAAACASCAVGPEFVAPERPAEAGYSPAPIDSVTLSTPGPQGASQTLMFGAKADARWWTLFGSPQLDAVIERALQANPNIDSARASLRIAQENLSAQRALYLPTVSVGYNFNRTKQAGSVPAATTATPATAGPDSIYSFHTAQLNIAYAPDIFGGNRRAVESLQAQAEAQQLQLRAAQLSIAANLTGAVVQDALLRSQLALVESMIGSGEQSLRIVNRQWKAGAVSHLEVALQEGSLAQTRQQLPALRRQLEQNEDLIRVLTGSPPSIEIPKFDLDSLRLPETVPVSLPAQLVEQRPDILQAQALLHAASAQIGVARAARLPQFSISANAGGGAERVAELFSPGGRFFAFIAGVTQPVFDAGALRSKENAARAAYDQAAAQYRATLLSALQNVADSLHAVNTSAQSMRYASEGAQSARTVLQLTQRQYGHGYLDNVALINAQQADRQARMTLLQARAARLNDTVALFQALGGSFDPE